MSDDFDHYYEATQRLTSEVAAARDVLREARPIVAAYLAHAESKGDAFDDKASRARYALVHIDAALGKQPPRTGVPGSPEVEG